MGANKIAFLQLLLVAAFAHAASGALPCPDGTQRQSKVIENIQQTSEVCVDTRTGLREGPARLLRDDGRLVSELEYRAGKPHGLSRLYDDAGQIVIVQSIFRDGEETSTRMTLEGLRLMAATQTAAAKKAGRRWVLTVVDEHTLRYETTKGFFSSWFTPNADDMRKQLIANPETCNLMNLPAADIRTIQTRSVNEFGKLLTEAHVHRADCPAAGEASQQDPD